MPVYGKSNTSDAQYAQAQKKAADLQKSNDALNAQMVDLRSKSIDYAGDIAKGKEFGQEVLGPEGLGRLGTDTQVQESLQGFKNIADQGLSRQEVAAERSQAFRGIESGTQTGMRSLQAQLARSGVKGAVAGQQLMQREMAGAQQKADVEQNLFLKSEQIKREGLADYSQRMGDVKQFDLGQAAKEKDIIMQSGLGFAQIGSSERTAKYAAERSKEASVASAAASKPSCFVGTTLVKLASGTSVTFDKLQPGMELDNGGIIMGVSKHLALDPLYSYKDIKVTGNHFVFHKNEFVKVKDTDATQISYEVDDIFVYNLITTSGFIIINDIVFSDYDDDKLVKDEKMASVPSREVQ